MFGWLWLAVTVLLLDQATKQLALAQLVLHEPVALLPFLNLTLVYNKGAAFGFLSSASGWQNAFFIVVALAACGVILYLLRQTRERLFAVALMLVLGGAIGNLVDRLIYGYVVDFVDVYYQSWHWPAFNIADSAITIGAILIALDAIRVGKSSPSAD
ncbi:MAG TPA: signal peptidase II [Burkholderiales bacterium]|nr:signal peptidase II [Burkholderiales bacterium]